VKNNRETWLNQMARELKTRLFKRAGYNLNLRGVKISCGFPSTGWKGKRIGECHSTHNNGFNEIFIHPNLSDSVRVAGVLAHELVHAFDDCKSGHGAPFRKLATAIGLEGKMTATTESEAFVKIAKKIITKIGKYPHKKMTCNKNRKKQTTRMVKVVCNHCNIYHVRMSRTMFYLAPPVCGYCTANTNKSPFELKMNIDGEKDLIKEREVA